MSTTPKDPQLATQPSVSKEGANTRSLIRSAVAFGSGTMISRVLGFSRDALLANMLARDMTDAYTVAFRLPNLFRRLLGEGALSVSFIPQFIDILHKQKDLPRAQNLVHSVFTLLFWILTVITATFIIFMDEIIHFLVPGSGFSSVPGKTEATIEMARWCFGFIIFICFFALYMAVLNGLKKFWLSGMAPAIMNLTLIIGTLATAFYKTEVALVLGLSTLIAGFLQWWILVPSVHKAGFKPRLLKNPLTQDLKNVLKPLGPSLIGLGSFQITTFINTSLVSHLPQGTLTYINMADRVLELPLSLIAVSLQTALLPTLAGYWAEGQIKEMVSTSQRTLKLNYYLAVPAAFGMYVLSEPIVRVLFDWRGFGAEEIAVTASVLKIYALTLITAGGVRIVAQNYYAMKDTWTPAKVAMTVTAIHLPMAWWMTSRFGLHGLNFATFLTSLFNLVLLTAGLKKRLMNLQTEGLLFFMLKCGAASSVMVIALRILRPFIFSPVEKQKILGSIALGCLIGIGGLIYFVMTAMLRMEETRAILTRVKQRLSRKKSRSIQ